ncbi:MAG TPA: DNA-binding protein [Bacillus bacterium]|nr:DNA-binding protein [Bacillus sp. (in: firmicutes)]
MIFKTVDEFKAYIANEVVNTAEASEILECSRQNISQLVKYGTLVPIKAFARDSIFLRSEIEQHKLKMRKK